MDMEIIGARIREARKAAGLSQAQLARRRGMSRSTISQIETGTIAEIGVRRLGGLLMELRLDLNVEQVVPPTLGTAFTLVDHDRFVAEDQTSKIIRQLGV